MKGLQEVLSRRLSATWFDARVSRLIFCVAGLALVPMTERALVRNPGSRVEFALGMGLGVLGGLLCVMLGLVSGEIETLRGKVPTALRWPEFASYGGAVALLVVGIRALATFRMTPAQVVLALLVTCALGLAVLLLGMVTTLVRSSERREG